MTHYKPCPECKGQGSVLYERVYYSHNYGRDVGFIEEYEDTCENCGGTGQIEDDGYNEEEDDNG
jgi:DnaJ-class molecular chaperone